MSSIEKAIERFKKTTKYGSDKLDIDFALTEQGGNQSGSSNRNEATVQKSTPLSLADDDIGQGAGHSNFGIDDYQTPNRDPYALSSSRGQVNRMNSPLERHGGLAAQQRNRPHYSFNYTALSQQGFLIPNSERNTTAEEYRSLKRPILMNAFGKGAVPIENGNLVMVTSAVPGEGKTFSSFNLAMSMAMERDKTVLLVDSDVLRGSMTKLLGLSGRIGLLEVLKDSSITLNDVILKTDIPNFSILPAGQPQLNSTELLASEEMERVTSDLSSRYPDRIIIFDAPPLMATTEASVLTELMGQVLMVVECGGTQQSVVKEAIEQINKEKIIGLLLNKSRRTSRSEYYGGGGYYGK